MTILIYEQAPKPGVPSMNTVFDKEDAKNVSKSEFVMVLLHVFQL